MFFSLSSCFYITSPVRRAQKALKEKDCNKALGFFQEIKNKKQKLKIARKAPPLCLNTTPAVSLWFYNYLSEWEQTKKQKLFFKKKAGDLAFETVKNYEQALMAYSFLKQQAILESDKNFYSFRMAFSYFERGKWSATLKTLKPLLTNQSFHKKALFLKARTLLLKEEYQNAKTTFQTIRKLYPLYFKEQEMFLYLSFIFEEQKDFHRASLELKDFQQSSAFLREKIKQIKSRRQNQPGAG